MIFIKTQFQICMIINMADCALSFDPNDVQRRLLKLQNETGYDILQKHGQRIYGSPPPGWNGPQPGKGTEVYCYRIPRDCFEDELVPVFASVGKIYELRLMIEFSGCNRSYCYVRYCSQEEAKCAVSKLNNYSIRPGYLLAVTMSVDNRKLKIRTTPPVDKKLEPSLKHELESYVEGINKVSIEPRGWLEVEFDTHRQAALARRYLVPGNAILFEIYEVKQADWANPEVDGEKEGCSGVILCVKNIPNYMDKSDVKRYFDNLCGGQVMDIFFVDINGHVLVRFKSKEAAVLVLQRSNLLFIGNNMLSISWWNQKRVERVSHNSEFKGVGQNAAQSGCNMFPPIHSLNFIRASDPFQSCRGNSKFPNMFRCPPPQESVSTSMGEPVILQNTRCLFPKSVPIPVQFTENSCEKPVQPVMPMPKFNPYFGPRYASR